MGDGENIMRTLDTLEVIEYHVPHINPIKILQSLKEGGAVPHLTRRKLNFREEGPWLGWVPQLPCHRGGSDTSSLISRPITVPWVPGASLEQAMEFVSYWKSG